MEDLPDIDGGGCGGGQILQGPEPSDTRVRQFMNILEQLPRLCSPTICGTLSQPTTRSERASRGADMFEWSIEQKALLSPANITEDWQSNQFDLDPAWRKQESEQFFSQKTIAPSPMVVARSGAAANNHPGGRAYNRTFDDHMMISHEEENEEDEDDEDEEDDNEMTDDDDDDERISKYNQYDDANKYRADDDDDDDETEDADDDDVSTEIDMEEDEDEQHDEFDDDLLFSPAPVRSSQKMDVFSPATFSRVMEDEHTLQSTPKTTGLSKPTRTRSDIIFD